MTDREIALKHSDIFFETVPPIGSPDFICSRCERAILRGEDYTIVSARPAGFSLYCPQCADTATHVSPDENAAYLADFFGDITEESTDRPVGDPVGSGADSPASSVDVRTLAELPPLSKPHYSFPLSSSVMRDTELLDHCVRLMGTACGHLVWTPDEWWNKLFTAAKTRGAWIGINYSPFNRLVRQTLEAAGKSAGDQKLSNDERRRVRTRLALDLDQTYQKELALLIERLRHVKTLSERAGGQIGAVLLDHEALPVNELTRGVMCHKLNRFHFLVHQYLGASVKVIWFKYGAVDEASRFGGWRNCDLVPSEHPYVVPNDGLFGCTLYYPTEPYHQRAVLEKTFLHAAEHACTAVVPWVSLGRRFVRDNSATDRRRFDCDYPTAYSENLGAELNVRKRGNYAGQIPAVVFWPSPGQDPTFWPHFAAYCRGAANLVS